MVEKGKNPVEHFEEQFPIPVQGQTGEKKTGVQNLPVKDVRVLIDFYEEFPGHIEHAEAW